MGTLHVRNLTMRFGGLVAVNSVDFEVRPGEILSLIGPNGAGKTTVFNAVTGVYLPSAGEVRFDGRCLQTRLAWPTFLRFLLVGIVVALGLLVLCNIQSLWEAAINNNYVYLEPFPWGQALASGFSYFFGQPAALSIYPLLIGFIIGTGAAYAVWSESRCTPASVAKCGIARTFQNIRLFQGMSVLENVLVAIDARSRVGVIASALRLPSFNRAEMSARAQALQLLEFVELKPKAALSASALSYGHQRRLEIARALATNPKLILLDEPAAGMNPNESGELIELVRKIRDRGISVLLIEHHMKVVMSISDRIVVLDYGNHIAEGTADQVRSNPRVIEAYLGKEEQH